MFQRDRFDKPYIPNVMIDNKLIIDAFLIAGSMNVSELSQFMMINMIPYSIVDMMGNTLIHKVISDIDVTKTEYQRLVMIKFLYNENVNPDAPNNMNLTPLHLACIKQYKDIINFLLEIGVDVNYKDNFGNTPLHRLMTGNIIPEEKITQGNLIPASKKVDNKMMELWKQERSNIWEEIKTSPFIQAIDKTLQSSIGSEEEEKNVVRDFQDRYLAMNLDLTKQDDIKKAKDLKGPSMNRFKEIIENKWSKFANNSNISIHNETEYSYPKNLPNNLSVIKAADTMNNIKVNIKANMQNIINQNNINININTIDTNVINSTLINDFVTDNYDYLHNNGDTLDLNNFMGIKDDYITYNERFKIKNTIDFADNVIDIENKTFMGSSRVLYIEENVNTNDLSNFMINPNNIIPKLLYTLFVPFNQAITFNGVYNIIGDPKYDNLIKLLVNYINDNASIDDMNDYTRDLFNSNMNRDFNTNIANMLNDMFNYDKITWLYSFITKFMCNKGLLDDYVDYIQNYAIRFPFNNYNPTNISGNIPETVIYLISGLIHNKTNIIQSISFAMRPKFIRDICDEPNNNIININGVDNVGIVITSLIYLILSDEPINNIMNNINGMNLANIPAVANYIENLGINDNLKNILIDCFKTYNNINNIHRDIDIDIDDYEYLCVQIKKYYNNMEQPARLQEVINIIDIIHMSKPGNEYNINIYKKIYGMHKMYDYNNLAQPDIHNYIPGLYDLFNRKANQLSNILRKQFVLFGEKAFYYWVLSENCLSSEFNFFIHNDENSINTNTPITVINLCKFIESHMLGLEFIGIINATNAISQPVNRININMIQLFNTALIDTTDINTFDPFIGSLSFFNIQDINGPRIYFPTSIINYVGGLLQNINNVQNMINHIYNRIKFMFTNFNYQEKSSTYATIIAYAYPYISTFSKYLQRMSNYMKILAPQYSDAFNYIQRVMTNVHRNNEDLHYNLTEILNNISTFNLSQFERSVNIINANLFLQYYISTNTNTMKIPKFIYHQLGDKPLLVFDENIDITMNRPDADGNILVEDITILDNKKGSDNKIIGSYQDIYNNSIYLRKEIYDRAYHASKNTKLPPSLRSVLYYFYSYHVVETIKSSRYEIDDNMVPGDINSDMKAIQKEYIKAKMVEELFQLYFKNKIEEYGNNIYNKLIGKNPRLASIMVEKVFGPIDFNILLNKPISETTLETITNNLNNYELLTSLFQFTEMKQIKPQFYIYPEKYFETTLLKNKYRVNIHNDIIKNIMENGANIFNHNEDSTSAVVMMIKNKYYEGLNILKNYIKMDDYVNNKHVSPYSYMVQQYKAHTALYNDNFIDAQYKEIVTIIQANETYRQNILKYLDTSFKTVVYMTEHYLSELLLRLSDNYTHQDLIKTLRLLNFNINDFTQNSTNYNDMLDNIIFVPTEDYGLNARNIYMDMRKQRDEIENKLEKYRKEKTLLNNAGLRDNMDVKINNMTQKLININTNIGRINRVAFNLNIQHSTILVENPKIIQRYEDTLRGMNMNVNCYMEGWRQYLHNKPKTIENIPSLIILQDQKNITILEKYYNHITTIIKEYFEKPRYLDDNKPLNFVYDMLVHNTKTFICGNINNIIKRILFEYIIETNKTGVTNAMEMIDYIVDPINDYLYNTIPAIFVRNSVGIFKNYSDEMENISMTVAEVLNNLLDLLVTSSPVKIDSYVLNIMKNNINQYFDTIVYKIINNWNVVVENIFIYNINQHRNILCLLALTL